MTAKDSILIFKNKLLEFSETFIQKQGESIKSFRVLYLCSRKIDGFPLPSSRWFTVTNRFFASFFEILFIYGIFKYPYILKIRRLNPVLIHVHFGVDGALLCTIRKKLNIPIITTFHGYDITVSIENAKKSFLLHRRYHKYLPELKSQGDLFIAVSDFIKERLISNGFDESKIVRHYIGVDTNSFKRTLPILHDKNEVLFVGRLVEKKGVFDLLEAFRVVKYKVKDAVLTIVGDGPLKNDVEEYIKRHELSDIRLLGKRTQEEIKDLLVSSKVFCVPSKTAKNGDCEAFGIVFIEAQAMGCPVASYRHGGIPEAVQDGVTGLLADEGDIEKLGENLTTLLLDEELNLRMSNSAINHVKEKFCLENQSRKLESIYLDLIQRKDA